MNPTGLGGVRSQTGMHKVHSLQLSLTVPFFLFFYEATYGRHAPSGCACRKEAARESCCRMAAEFFASAELHKTAKPSIPMAEMKIAPVPAVPAGAVPKVFATAVPVSFSNGSPNHSIIEFLQLQGLQT